MTDGDLIYIGELARIVNRQVGTLRKWDENDFLPKHLQPQRGKNGWRCWTKTQVYGRNGILNWMKKHHIRPGNTVTPPESEQRHIANLRKPKRISKRDISYARRMVEKGRSCEYIIDKVFPRTTYSSPDNLEKALRKWFKKNGWDFPASEAEKPIKVTPDEVIDVLKRLAA